MKRIERIGLLAIILAAVVGDGAAEAKVLYTHGTVCQPFFGHSTLLSFGQTGVGNWSGSQFASVTCPAWTATKTQTSSGSLMWWGITSGRVLVGDNSATQPLSCNVWTLDEYGWGVWGPLKFSCSLNGGCPDSTTIYTGPAWLTFAMNPFWTDDMVGYSCTLPPSAPYASWIVDMVSITGEP